MLKLRALAALCVLVSTPASALDALQIRIEGGPVARLDLGALRAAAGRAASRGVQVRERVRVRIDDPRPGVVAARLWVSLAMPVPGVAWRVDGVSIGSAPVLVDAVHRLGVEVVHVVEVQVPADVEAGPFLSDLVWTAETD